MQQGRGAQGADAAVGAGMGVQGSSASGKMDFVPIGDSASEQHGCFVHLEAIESKYRGCTMCKRAYCVEDIDGSGVGGIGLRNYPVELSCSHLVIFGCARVLIRMYVNCTECGASFGDGRVELAGLKKQIQSFEREVLSLKATVDSPAVEAGSGEVQGSASDLVMVEDGFAGDDVVQLTREDVEGALALLGLGGKIFGMEDIEAGLALSDLQAGTDTTLEDYLLAISR